MARLTLPQPVLITHLPPRAWYSTVPVSSYWYSLTLSIVHVWKDTSNCLVKTRRVLNLSSEFLATDILAEHVKLMDNWFIVWTFLALVQLGSWESDTATDQTQVCPWPQCIFLNVEKSLLLQHGQILLCHTLQAASTLHTCLHTCSVSHYQRQSRQKEKMGRLQLVLPDSSVSEEVSAWTTECVVLPLKHGGQVDHGGRMVCVRLRDWA